MSEPVRDCKRDAQDWIEMAMGLPPSPDAPSWGDYLDVSLAAPGAGVASLDGRVVKTVLGFHDNCEPYETNVLAVVEFEDGDFAAFTASGCSCYTGYRCRIGSREDVIKYGLDRYDREALGL